MSRIGAVAIAPLKFKTRWSGASRQGPRDGGWCRVSARAPIPPVDDTERRAFSVAVYPRHKERVLLIFHKRLQKWLPPGGELLPAETPLEAAHRELKEETGLIGSFPRLADISGVPRGLLGYEEHLAGSKGLHMNFVFVADVDTATIVPNEEFEIYRWVTLDEGPWEAAPPNVRDFAALAFSSRAVG